MAKAIELAITLNGGEVRDTAPADRTLLWYLREKRNLTGAKNACAKGHCGACTVVMNGKAQRSCLVPLRSMRLKGATIETIEGLTGPDGRLHPIQQAFVDCGAVQCGFCTPGMIMSARALLLENPDPSDEEIRSHFTRNRNICRCTGYVKIIQAVKDAALRLRGGTSPYVDSPDDMSIRRSEATGKVTGDLKYGDDYRLDGMLSGRILWAAHPQAILKSIDTTEAEKMPGVEAVITWRDVEGTNRVGLVERDGPAIVAVGERVRFIGDPIAGVIATSDDAAREALEKIAVEYEILPGVFTIDEAAAEGAPLVHDGKAGNLFHHVHIERGDVEEEFAACPIVEEDEFETPRIEHAFMEPESGIGLPDGMGGVILELPTQTIFDDRAQLSEALAIAKDKIRIVQIPMGGCFGAKEEIILQTFLVLGVLKTGKPVKMTLSREESLRVHQKRHPARIHYRLGTDEDGTFRALDVSIKADKGAYASLGVDILENMAVFAGGPYFIPAVRIDAKSWHTNTVMSGAMRGFGANQVGFAVESMIDRIARRLAKDPFEIRLRNALVAGLPTVADHVLEPGIAGIRETLTAVRDELVRTDLPEPGQGKKIGVGIACGVKNIGFGHDLPESSGAIVEMDTSGRVTLKVTHHEYGQGALTGEIGICAQSLGIPRDRITIIGPDTAQTPATGPSTASRQTYLTGNAVVGACRRLMMELNERAARHFNIEDPGYFYLEGDEMVARLLGHRVKLGELGDGFSAYFRYFPTPTAPLQSPGEKSLYGKDGFRNRPTHWCYAYGTQAAIVEVDEATGDVRVLKVIAAHDVGRIINRRAVEGQIEGGVVMGVGYALSEQYVVKEGFNITDTLLKCGLVTADRAPEVVVLPVEVPHPDGPLGLKGLAEAPSLPTAPAILNAVYDAVGVRISSLPATKEKVLEALRAKESP